MIIIYNYGNVNGPNTNQNTPEYVENTIRMGYHCRIDVTYSDHLYMNNCPIILEFLCNFSMIFTHRNKKRKLLNVITLGNNKSDYINRLSKITDDFYLLVLNKWGLCNLIPLSG
jgi:hypothetical protein